MIDLPYVFNSDDYFPSYAPINVMPHLPPLGEGWGNIGDLCKCPYTRALILVQIPGVFLYPQCGIGTFCYVIFTQK